MAIDAGKEFFARRRMQNRILASETYAPAGTVAARAACAPSRMATKSKGVLQ